MPYPFAFPGRPGRFPPTFPPSPADEGCG